MGIFEQSVATFLAPVKHLLEDESVTEVLVNGPAEVFIERKGLLEKTEVRFLDEQALQAAVRNIAQFVGRRVDEENPMLDARLPDGSRIHAVLPPCSRRGTSLSIRKFGSFVPTFPDIIARGTVSKEAARFLDLCVYLGKNLIVSGGTGSGKTTLLNVLGSRVPKAQRLLVIEDASELKIQAEHCIFFETKAPNPQGRGGVSVRDLIKSALRLRPDRIIVGEVRGPEALDLITAMNTGHSGSMGTTHANSPYDALVRLETLAMMGDTNVPVMAIRRQIASAINIVVQIKRMNDGSRKITNISEVVPDVDEHGRYTLRDVYSFIQTGRNTEGRILGEHVPMGVLPSFYDEIELNRLPFPRESFQMPAWLRQKIEKNVNVA